MEVILKQDVEHLGSKDDIVKVKKGYALNYLIPRRAAILATESDKKALNEILKQRKIKEDKIKAALQKTAEAIRSAVIKIGTKVSSKGNIFGSITPLQVAETLKKLGYDVDRKQITFRDDSIKTTGRYSADIRLHKEITITVEFDVVEE